MSRHGPRQVLHVRSVSEWAPVCIGPYAQANTVACGGKRGRAADRGETITPTDSYTGDGNGDGTVDLLLIAGE